jgi:hypothetical protein
MGREFRPWSVVARNLSEHADNPIHTDEGARSAGFGAALVAGTTVHAYLTRPVVEAWGTGWLAGGTSIVEFLAPVEAGDPVDCIPMPDQNGSVEVRAEVRGDLRARLVARLGTKFGQAPVVEGDRLDDGPLTPWLERLDGPWTDYAWRAGDDLDIYADEGLVHPCTWTALANGVMVRHLVDGSWIHTRSQIIHHTVVPAGAAALVEARVADKFETRRGTRAVVDVHISVDGVPVADIVHEALVSLRPTDL